MSRSSTHQEATVMASEDLLKKAVAAFKALSPDQQAEMLEEQRQSWVRGNIGLSRDERGMTSTVMHRPAPAATDTGLETVAKQHRLIRGGYQGSWQPYAAPIFADDKYETRELVTRSQAEELLAAERSEHDNTIATLTSLITDNAALIHDLNRIKDHETELVNDNAAKDARIKELEQALETEKTLSRGDWACQREVDQMSIKVEALEAKLAAAEKALKTARPYVEDYDTRRHNTGVDETLTQIDAALGGKPS